MYFHQKLSEHENEANLNENDIRSVFVNFEHCFGVSIINFERANTGWVATNLEYDFAGTEMILEIYTLRKSEAIAKRCSKNQF